MRRFTIWSPKGGVEAEGVQFTDGSLAVRWRGKTFNWEGMEALTRSMREEGSIFKEKAEVQWNDPDLPARASAR